jgi:hypothetical protein
MRATLDYKTHILIGAGPVGAMGVIGVWPYVPKQADVEKVIAASRDRFVTFALCTPTSILPGTKKAEAPHWTSSGQLHRK